MISQWLSTIGLIFDMIGACLVAIEVVKQFKGKKYENDPTWDGIGKPPWNTDEYKLWELRKYFWMKVGLSCLVIGFSLQIASNWVLSAKTSPAPQSCEIVSSTTKG